MLWPREAGKFIASLSRDVKIRPDGVTKTARVVADAVKSGQLGMEAFKQVRWRGVFALFIHSFIYF
ncbi:hypothetical protein E2C01_039987 [Portunus trituberculatus]|uniref:Uncharacterized protein n=1 Tax=Portunus trituberculatus TaxID=210409 RepID=A0A5B7FMD3_PORTR|nr:hypothetical protein [Portunus trituberculatus]